jgi:Cysteine-rich CPXCG
MSDERDDELDDEFPLGEGTADDAATVQCPYCGAAATVTLDPGGGAVQDYVEDCQVCCRPWRVRVRYDEAGGAEVVVAPLDA